MGVADRLAVGPQVRQQLAGRIEPGQPQPHQTGPGGVGGEQLGPPAARERQLRRRRAHVALGARARRAARLDHPEAARLLGRQVQAQPGPSGRGSGVHVPVGSVGVQGRRDHRRGVHDQQVAGIQRVTQITEAVVADISGGASGHHQADIGPGV